MAFRRHGGRRVTGLTHKEGKEKKVGDRRGGTVKKEKNEAGSQLKVNVK